MMTAPQPHSPSSYKGIVKQIISGETIVIRGPAIGGPPQLKTITLTNIKTPKLAKRATPGNDETKDEPWAWEAREFMRKKLIGELVVVIPVENKAATAANDRVYGTVYHKDVNGENINEAIVAEGLASVRPGAPDSAKLQELETQAKTAGKGIWSADDRNLHVRDVKWVIENMRSLLDKYEDKPVKAIIEHVRDGSTVRCFLLPDFYHITLMLSGIRCNGYKLDTNGRPDPNFMVEYADEAKFFVESRLLQRDVEVLLETVNNNNFVGTILHPKGNIAELLLKEGFAKCVDWSIAFMKSGAEKLRAAEKEAKEKRIRLWKNYQPATPIISGKEKEFTGTVMEVVNGDALMIKLPSGQVKKVFLSSIRPPRDNNAPVIGGDASQLPPRSKNYRPLYEIPWLYEAREFLRKKLIGKKVNVVVDYIQPARESFPEKTCCTVTISGVNVAEVMVSKGLATVVKHRQDDDQRSFHYDALQAAEVKAQKDGKGLHDKKDTPTHRINDYAGDSQKAKHLLPHLKRGNRIEALVEFVASGSRLRIFIPKESCLVTFLLAGINCQKVARPAGPVSKGIEGDPYGEEALIFTKERCLQREVEINVEGVDKAGNFIGWMWIDNVNLSIALVQEGLAEVHSSAEYSEYHKELTVAEKVAKKNKLKMWTNYTDNGGNDKTEEEATERKIDQQRVFVIETTPELHIFVQHEDKEAKLENMLGKLRQELLANPPLPGAYTPRKGDLCAAKYVQDNEWYRAKVERVIGGKAHVLYVDYGNRDEIPFSLCGQLPSTFTLEKPFAHEYMLACVKLPSDPDYIKDAVDAIKMDIAEKWMLMNVEYRIGTLQYVTLVDDATNTDVIEALIKEGLLLVDNSKRDKRVKALIQQYTSSQDKAKASRLGVWRYGDITEDDDKEFGLGR